MDINGLIGNVLQKLSEDDKTAPVRLEFTKLLNYDEKVKFMENLFIEYELMPMKEVPLKIEKNNETSMKLRQSGDKCFALKSSTNLFEALEFYNESIAYAECNTENLSLCYENRSDIYFELKMYDICLENIKLAKENRSPDSSIEKLTNRELICNNEIQQQNKNDKIVYIPELSYPPHEKIPFIANCLELCEHEKYGRYIKTNIDLEPGNIIAIEKPFSTLQDPSKKYICCANCLSENSLNLIPCLNCTSAMFCNEKCRIEAFNNFHQYECPIIDYLFQMFESVPLNALRLTIKAILAFKSTQKLIAFTQNTNTSNIAEFILNYDDNSEEQKYYSMYALATNEGKRSDDDSFCLAITAATMHHYIYNYTHFKQYLETADDRKIFAHLLYKHFMTVTTNSHSIDFTDLRGKAKPDDNNIYRSLSFSSYGCATYAFSSMLNHSCAPNINRITFNTDTVIYAIKSIKSGEQLFDNYGFHYCSTPKDTRQNELSTHYHFRCECIACNDNFPLFTDLVKSEIDMPPPLIYEDDYKTKSLFKKEIALDCIEKYKRFLTKYGYHSHASKIVYEIQKLLHLSYIILVNKINFRLQLYVNN